MTAYLEEILAHYDLGGTIVFCDHHGCGHINKTYLIETDAGESFVLQGINDSVFKNVEGLMHNIEAVTSYLRQRTEDPRRVLQLIRTKEGTAYQKHSDGTFWRVFTCVKNAICLQTPETPDDFYESAVAFGQFQEQLKEFPAHTLVETIPNFHNTRDRYRIFRETWKRDPKGRAASVQNEIEFVLEREEEASTLVRLLEEGKLPLRVTHNDTKLNNVMLDAETRKAFCVIDLDTVMPGSSLYDFGDAIRFGAATAAEDEQDLAKMELDLALFETFAKGYLTACPGLSELEKQLMPLGAKILTLECGLRFLTDYLDGDHYFAVHREGHNLDRCRTQFKLVADMEKKWDEMNRIIAALS